MLGGNNPNTPIEYGASYKSTMSLAANTPDTIFSAAANVNGAIVWAIYGGTVNSGNVQSAYLAKTSAPATVIDGDIICGPSVQSALGASISNMFNLAKPIKIPAGKGLYFLSTNAEVASIVFRGVLYTLL